MEEEELYPPRFVVKVNGHQATDQATALVNIKFITTFIVCVYSTGLTCTVDAFPVSITCSHCKEQVEVKVREL